MGKLQELDIDDFLLECVRIDQANLREEFTNLPSQLAYWNERYSRAHKAHLAAKVDRERTEARLSVICRERLLARATAEAEPEQGDTEGKKAVKKTIRAPTVDQVAAAVAQDPDFVEARDAEISAEVEKSRLYGVVDAIRAKKDMLISLGAQLRAEMDGDPMVKEYVRAQRFREG